jgi:plasmid stability protein
MNASHLTVRNLPEELADALAREKQRRGTSLNKTVIDLLEQSLGVRSTRSNGLRKLSGTWTANQQREFLDSIRCLDEIDQDLWR